MLPEEKYILLMEAAYTATNKDTYYELMQKSDQVLKDTHITVDIINAESEAAERPPRPSSKIRNSSPSVVQQIVAESPGSGVALSQTLRPFSLSPHLGRSSLARISTTPSSSLPPTGICQSEPRNLGNEKNRIILASTDDKGEITVLQTEKLFLATNYGLALSIPP